MSERKNNLREIKSEMVDISNHTEEEFKSYASITIKGLLDWCFGKSEWEDSTVIEQSRPKGDAIIEGITLKVKVNGTYEAPKPNTEEETNE